MRPRCSLPGNQVLADTNITTITEEVVDWGDGQSNVYVSGSSNFPNGVASHPYNSTDAVLGYAVGITVVGKDSGNHTLWLHLPHIELPLATTPFLPSPVYQGPSPEPTYPSDFDTFDPPIVSGKSADAGSPQVDQFTRSATPGTSLALTAESLSTASGSAYGEDTSFLAFGQTTVGNATLLSTRTQTLDGQAASLTLPDSLPYGSEFLVWPRNDEG